MRGWLALLRRATGKPAEPSYYSRLVGLVEFYSRWHIVSYDAESAKVFESLRKEKVRIGTMDLKIASIALSYDCLLLSANLRDFEQVPGLRVEDWLH